MPTVPLVERDVETRPVGAPQLGQLPTVQGVGAGFQQLGKDLGEVARVAKERGDTVALLDASSQLDTWEQNNLYSPDGAFSKKGKNAIGLPNSTASQFDSDIQEISKGLGNDDQRVRFQQLAQNRRAQMMNQLFAHERKEMDDYGKSVWKGKQQTGLDRVESNFDNQQVIDNTVADLQAANTGFMQKQGLSDEEIAAENHEIEQKAYLRALGKKAVTDPDGFLESIKNGVDAESVSSRPGQARGIRNNNPGNLRGDDDWQGKTGADSDGYLKFATAADGLRAMAINLKNQQAKHGLSTLNEIIAKYAPETENDTEAYQKQAAQALGVDGDRPINLQNPEMLSALMTFMVKKENGNQPYPQGSIDRAANIALNGAEEAPTGGPVVPKEPNPLTGNRMYDALPFDVQYKLVRLAETMVTRQRVQFRADVEKRIKDSLAMAQDGVDDSSVAPSAEEFNKAYGYDEGPAKFKEYQDLRQVSVAINEVATQTPTQQMQTLEANKPQAGAGYAKQDAKYKTLEQAVVQSNKMRADDPIAFAMKYGLAPNEPLQLNSQQQLASQLPVRAATADQMAKTYGTPVKPLTNGEAMALSQALDKMTPTDQLTYLANFRNGLTDPRMYQAALQQLRPDSPVTAVAGAFVGLEGNQVIREHTFSANESVTPLTVAQRLVEGEALLNPTKFEKKEDGKPSSGKVFPMPPDSNEENVNGLRSVFNAYVGNSFRGMPETANIAYQSFRAYYAAESARRGDYSGVLNNEIAEESVRAVVGNVVEKGEGNAVAPWGMDETTFLDNAKTDFDDLIKEQGLDPERVKWGDITLENTGDPGEYRAKIGAGYLVNRDGQPLIITALGRRP